MKPFVVESSPAWSLAVQDNLLVSVWRTSVELGGIRATDVAIERILAQPRFPHYGSITVVEPQMSLRLSDEAREAGTRLQARWKDRMRCSAYLVEGNSFAMAAVRGLTAGLSLMTRSPFPIRSFHDALGASEWVAEVLSMPPTRVRETIGAARGG